jgi:hypothetical protein
MWRGSFDPKEREVLVDVVVHGPLGARSFTFLLDTGTERTVIDPSVLDSLGYGARMGRRVSHLLGAGGVQPGYLIEVTRLGLFDVTVAPVEVFCHDLPVDLGIEGLIGMDLVEGRVVTLDAVQGIISVGDAAA